MNLVINELFAPTVQGEGLHAGQLVGFIRLANCNLACSWCDTPYSWDWERFDKKVETATYGTKDLADIIRLWGVRRIIITGGEPLLQQAALCELINRCPSISFDVETNGTIAPTSELASIVDLFNVSPKLAHSGDIVKKRLKSVALEEFVRLSKVKDLVSFKFVCQQISDLDEVGKIQIEYGIPASAVWIMPEGADIATHLKNLEIIADAVCESGYNLTTRLHILAWGSKRAK